jgi:uncharacterized protein YndB with AHSA1/START domain
VSELAEITPCYTIAFERRSKHAPPKLWKAITDGEQVTRWMTFPARIDLRVGGDYFVDFSRATANGNLDGVIVRLETERNIAYVWGRSVLEFTLEPDGEGTRYSFVHHGQPPGLVDPEAGIAAGWHAWLDDFDAYLDGTLPEPNGDPTKMRRLEELYRDPIGAALGSVDPGSP